MLFNIKNKNNNYIMIGRFKNIELRFIVKIFIIKTKYIELFK